MDFDEYNDDVLNEAIECEELSSSPKFLELDISIPGEKPKHAPSDVGFGNPGETPKGRINGQSPEPKGGKTQLPVSTWADALTTLKQTFKEGAEIIEDLMEYKAQIESAKAKKKKCKDEEEIDECGDEDCCD